MPRQAVGKVAVVPGGVFINYRGEDSRSYGALLHAVLSQRFGSEQVFLDAESIPAGADYTEQLLSRVRGCRVLLAVIGQRWLTITGTDGRRRIDDPGDWLRRELAEAFTARVRVVPVLVDGADMPIEADLPADIAALARCQYRRLRHHDATADSNRIIAELTTACPDLAADAAVPGTIGPFVFNRTAYRDRKALAMAMAKSWDTAARRYFEAMGTEHNPSEAWHALRTWLRQFNNPAVDDVEALQSLIDRQLSSPTLPPDVKLLALLRWLDPALPAVYRGLSIDRDNLWAVAQRAADASAEDHLTSRRMVDDLYRHRLLPQLAAMNAPDLEAIDEAWVSTRAEYDRRAAQLSELAPEAVRGTADESILDAELLALALCPQWQAEAGRAVALPVPIDWFNQVCEAAQSSPIDGLVLIHLGAAAIRQSQVERQRQAEADAERRQRQSQWDQQEVQRLAARPQAKALAARYFVGIWVGALLMISYIAWTPINSDYDGLEWWFLANLAAPSAAAAYITISELNLVKELGGDYNQARRFPNAGGRLWSNRGKALLGTGLALYLVVAFPMMLVAIVAGLHAWSTYRRRSRWRQWHAEQRRTALGSQE